MPVTEPATSDLNFTPSSTGLPSPESTVPGVVQSKIVFCGVTAFVAVDCAPVPAAVVAATLNV